MINSESFGLKFFSNIRKIKNLSRKLIPGVTLGTAPMRLASIEHILTINCGW
jgi:hypothetical protein